nr:hypothetical protein [uncultured Anaerostipes sp.]
MICPRCNTDNPENARFCRRCRYEFPRQPVRTENDRTSNKKILYIFIGAIFIITVAVALKLYFEDTGGEANDTILSDESSASSEGSENTSETKEGNSNLPEIISNEEVDYNKIISLHDYKTFYADGYSFGFPLLLYETVEEFGDNGYRFSSQSDEYSWLEFETGKRTDNDSLENYTNERCIDLKGEMADIEEILHKPEKGICVIAGVCYDDRYQKLYHVLRVTDDTVYYMSVGFPDIDDSETRDKINYYVDCLYRMCSFSGGTYKPRTYDQFLNDDMGTKK